MTGRGRSGRGNQVRRIQPDARRDVADRARIGSGHLEAIGDDFGAIAGRGVRPTIAELRERARLARANQPSSTQYVVWSLALNTGQPFDQIERLTWGNVLYFADLVKTGKVPDAVS
jgi:hypothetical protein